MVRALGGQAVFGIKIMTSPDVALRSSLNVENSDSTFYN
jgi:hypothetical protein